MAKLKKPKAQKTTDLGSDIIGSMNDEFHNASDRAMAVLGAAYLDSILEQLLRATFVDDEDEVDKLLSPDRPIGGNGARYQLAFCLGLIDAKQRDDLKTIAKIRNVFAHNYSSISLADDPARSFLQSLDFAKRREGLRRRLSLIKSDSASKRAMKESASDFRAILKEAIIEFLIVLLPRIQNIRRANSSLWFTTG